MAGGTIKTGFWAYWWRVLKRGIEDTRAVYPLFQDFRQALVRILGNVLAAVVFALVADEAQWVDEVTVFGAFAIAVAVTFLFVLAWNVTLAPSRIDGELRAENHLQRLELSKRADNKAAAEALGKKFDQVEKALSDAGMYSDRVDVFISPRKWESEVIQIMQSHGVPEHEIHMFKTVSHIPHVNRATPRMFFQGDLRGPLELKRNKLRLIIARLLKEQAGG